MAIFSHLLPGIGTGQFYDSPETYGKFAYGLSGACEGDLDFPDRQVGIETIMALYWRAKKIEFTGGGSYTRLCEDTINNITTSFPETVTFDIFGQATLPQLDPCTPFNYLSWRTANFSITGYDNCIQDNFTSSGYMQIRQPTFCVGTGLFGSVIIVGSPDNVVFTSSVTSSSYLTLTYDPGLGITAEPLTVGIATPSSVIGGIAYPAGPVSMIAKVIEVY